MKFQGKIFPFRGARMGRTRLVHKLLYGGVVVLCLVSCWNARLLYSSKDNLPPKHVDFMRQVIGQRDVLFDTVSILKQKCSDEKLNGSSARRPLANRNSSCSKPQLWKKPDNIDLDRSLVLGFPRKQKGFLTIGIPTVLRETERYLDKTLDSLIRHATPQDFHDVTLVVFLADQLEEKRNTVKNMLMDNYMKYLEEGFIQVIQAPAYFYPPLENLKGNFGDKADRVRWRAKQAVDFAFMFIYSQSLSDYYLQIEDDVVTTAGYVGAITDYIEQNVKNHWVTLEFSVLGFIGKLFHSYDLDRLAQFMMFFYQDQPVDFLYRYFNMLNGQQDTYLRVPTLFQHKGKQSSLKDKVMDVKDQFFDQDQKQFRTSDNPPAMVFTSMEAFGNYLPQMCYSSDSGFFWAKKPQEGDVVVLVFNEPTLVSRIAITTGSQQHPSDTLIKGNVAVSRKLIRGAGQDGGNGLPQCGEYTEVGFFEKGQFDANVGEIYRDKVSCLRILVQMSQDQWMVLREIAIWIPH